MHDIQQQKPCKTIIAVSYTHLIGDTIRVSLTGDPVEEIKTAKQILKTLGLKTGGIEVVSCPTCGRTQIDLVGLAEKVNELVLRPEYKELNMKVACMGCPVNGPGEAKEAELGICGGKGQGLIIRKGEIIKKVDEDKLLEAFKEELDKEITDKMCIRDRSYRDRS